MWNERVSETASGSTGTSPGWAAAAMKAGRMHRPAPPSVGVDLGEEIGGAQAGRDRGAERPEVVELAGG